MSEILFTPVFHAYFTESRGAARSDGGVETESGPASKSNFWSLKMSAIVGPNGCN